MDPSFQDLPAAPPHLPVPYTIPLQAAVVHLKPAAALEQFFQVLAFPQAKVPFHMGNDRYVSGHGHFPYCLIQAVVSFLWVEFHQHVTGSREGQGLSLFQVFNQPLMVIGLLSQTRLKIRCNLLGLLGKSGRQFVYLRTEPSSGIVGRGHNMAYPLAVGRFQHPPAFIPIPCPVINARKDMGVYINHSCHVTLTLHCIFGINSSDTAMYPLPRNIPACNFRKTG